MNQQQFCGVIEQYQKLVFTVCYQLVKDYQEAENLTQETFLSAMLYRLIFIAKNAPDLFGSLIATGIFAHIAIKVILKIAVVTGLLPTSADAKGPSGRR